MPLIYIYIYSISDTISGDGSQGTSSFTRITGHKKELTTSKLDPKRMYHLIYLHPAKDVDKLCSRVCEPGDEGS